MFAASTLIPNQHRVATFAGAAVVVLHLGAAITPAHSAGGEAVTISDAWVHAAEQELIRKLETAGYTQVRDVKSTAEGIAAKAMKDGKEVSLVVDSSGKFRER